MTVPRTTPYIPGTDPETFADTCEVHGSHNFLPKYTEEHHVVPQGWQQLWHPEFYVPGKDQIRFPFAGKGTDGRWNWDNRTTTLCRNGHGNVHYWVVMLMKDLAVLHRSDPAIDESTALIQASANVRVYDPKWHRQEYHYGLEAPRRWLAAGGSLKLLTRLRQWGGIYG